MQDQYEEGALYAEDAIMYDEDYARSVMVAIAEASVAIEDAFGAPQDIEGVIKEDGSLYIVQTRPQVGPSALRCPGRPALTLRFAYARRAFRCRANGVTSGLAGPVRVAHASAVRGRSSSACSSAWARSALLDSLVCAPLSALVYSKLYYKYGVLQLPPPPLRHHLGGGLAGPRHTAPRRANGVVR
eukprot:scaffold3544_cov373-Prasinococcus_capsulatus_cf.AAC.3